MSEPANASDLELLARYSRHHAEDAFATLVRRHVDLVHSAALRQVRSPQLAEEVAQTTFTKLARLAPQLAPDTILTAWLYQVTRREAIDVVRREARRQLREQIATELNTMNATTADWAHIEPILDEAMAELDDTDRAAVLLRYFENKSLREVGATLGTSDDAAQKRVSRAVERLREFFAKRGITVGTSGLAVVISANAVQAAPMGLAVTISTAAALAGTTLATATTATAIKTIAMTTLQKTVITATLAIVAGVGIYEARQNSQLREQNQTLKEAQALLAEQTAQLNQTLIDATNRLAALSDDNERLSRNTAELPKLRGELTRLQNELIKTSNPTLSDEGDASSKFKSIMVQRIKQLKYLPEQMPEKRIPELQFLEESDWRKIAFDSFRLKSNGEFRKDSDSESEINYSETELRGWMSNLRSEAKTKFSPIMTAALRKYFTANNDLLPATTLELKPYFATPVADEILQRYVFVHSGNYKIVPDEEPYLVEAKPVDEEYDTQLQFSGDISGVPIKIESPAAQK